VSRPGIYLGFGLRRGIEARRARLDGFSGCLLSFQLAVFASTEFHHRLASLHVLDAKHLQTAPLRDVWSLGRLRLARLKKALIFSSDSLDSFENSES
jgi:hypothetical protein